MVTELGPVSETSVRQVYLTQLAVSNNSCVLTEAETADISFGFTLDDGSSSLPRTAPVV
jgi:hypothetical protein